MRMSTPSMGGPWLTNLRATTFSPPLSSSTSPQNKPQDANTLTLPFSASALTSMMTACGPVLMDSGVLPCCCGGVWMGQRVKGAPVSEDRYSGTRDDGSAQPDASTLCSSLCTSSLARNCIGRFPSARASVRKPPWLMKLRGPTGDTCSLSLSAPAFSRSMVLMTLVMPPTGIDMTEHLKRETMSRKKVGDRQKVSGEVRWHSKPKKRLVRMKYMSPLPKWSGSQLNSRTEWPVAYRDSVWRSV
mmetsp:Transcript_29142/g.72635  ORF Transcript_29142/g.72635 Transcript_29142/m.72635 type:complete len:244 (-) Transcript_29142:292-1023(-)